jgi:uncharacterized repeat protein (TIGR01451 family)
MRNTLTKVASLALIAGALTIPGAPASATTSTVAQTSTVLDEPFSVFDINLKASKTAKPGGTIHYKLVAGNVGPYDANAWFVGGQFPKGVDLKKISYSGAPKGTDCFLEGRALYCLVPYILKKGYQVTITFDAKLKKNAKGTQAAKLGVVSYDVQTGMEDMSKEEFERLGVPEHGYVKTAKTKIVR